MADFRIAMPSWILKLKKSPEDYVPAWFRKEMYLKAYTFYLKAVGRMSTWVPNNLNKPSPPICKRMPCRPKKKGRRASHEGGTSQGYPRKMQS